MHELPFVAAFRQYEYICAIWDWNGGADYLRVPFGSL